MNIQQRRDYLRTAQAALILLEDAEDDFKKELFEKKYKEAIAVLANDSEVKVIGDLNVLKPASEAEVASALNIA
jgi:hypothetical protein